jgi:hypothetical protein
MVLAKGPPSTAEQSMDVTAEALKLLRKKSAAGGNPGFQYPMN